MKLRLYASSIVGLAAAIMFAPVGIAIGDAFVPCGFFVLFCLNVGYWLTEGKLTAFVRAAVRDRLILTVAVFLAVRIGTGALTGTLSNAAGWSLNFVVILMLLIPVGKCFSDEVQQARMVRALMVTMFLIALAYGLWELHTAQLFEFKSSNFGKESFGLCVVLFVCARPILRTRRLWAASFSIAVILLVLSGERKGLAGAVLSGVALFVVSRMRVFRSRRRRQLASVMVGIGIILSGFAFVLFSGLLAAFDPLSLADSMSRVSGLHANSNQARTFLAAYTIHGFAAEPWLGHGVGTLKSTLATELDRAMFIHHSHDMLLRIGYESGLFAVFAYLSVVWMCFARGVRIYANAPTEATRVMGGVVVTLTVYAFVVNMLSSPGLINMFLFLLPVALAVGAPVAVKGSRRAQDIGADSVNSRRGGYHGNRTSGLV